LSWTLCSSVGVSGFLRTCCFHLYPSRRWTCCHHHLPWRWRQ